MKYTWINVFFQSVLLIVFTEQKSLDNFIQHYEELSYNTVELHQSHQRAKRSVRDQTLQLKFNAFKRDFKLVLQPDRQTFTKDAVLTQHGFVDTSHIYRGTVQGDRNSSIFGFLIDGHFTGRIKIPGDTTYHIEPTLRFIGKVSKLPVSHSIIYREEDVDLDPHRYKREAEKAAGYCGNDNVREWMQSVQNSAIFKTRGTRSIYEQDEKSYGHNKYSEALNRQKRAPLPKSQSACFLHMQSDPALFNQMKTKYGGDEVKARNDILGTFATHVDAINEIYKNTIFRTYQNDIVYTGVQFKIQRTTVMTPESEQCSNALNAKPFCQSNLDVSNFLNLNSLMNHNGFCLAYIFTYRDFTQGTLGLAWVGSSTQSSGGICEVMKEFQEGGSRVNKSLNTGVVTFLNYGDAVAPRVSQLTFAHEVGHNFGSPHDSGQECAPYDTSAPDAYEGNYIMYSKATKGNKAHNDKFSSCSRDNMTRVMDAVFNGRYGKVNCFKDAEGAYCGNGIVETGEQCDCGFEGYCTDDCCVGRQPDGSGCVLKDRKQCSPSQGSCCNPNTCAPYTDQQQCRPATDCMAAANCSGTAECPPSAKSKDYETLCSRNTKVCVDGYCTGSLCSNIDYAAQQKVTWVECFVQATGTDSAARERQCLLGCRLNSSSSDTCHSSSDANIPTVFKNLVDQIGGGKITLSSGSPCNDLQGYCDVFNKCRSVDADGPLSRLKNLLFSEETFTTIQEWIKAHWWAVILIAIGLILFMGLFIKVCAVHTPSSNPKAPPAQHWSDTLRRRRSHPRQQQNPRYSEEPLRQSPLGPPPPYSASASSSKPHPGHGRGPRGKGQGKKGKGKDARV